MRSKTTAVITQSHGFCRVQHRATDTSTALFIRQSDSFVCPIAKGVFCIVIVVFQQSVSYTVVVGCQTLQTIHRHKTSK